MSHSETEEADDGGLGGWMKYLTVKTKKEQRKIVEIKLKGVIDMCEAEGRFIKRGEIAVCMHEKERIPKNDVG